VGVLGHLAALIRIKEYVVNVEGGSNKGLLVSYAYGLGAGLLVKAANGPEALTNGAEINVNFDFVVLYEPLIPSLSRYLSAFSLHQQY
jgi:hypothetical protein